MPLEPFDPKKHRAVDMGLGGKSTEYLITTKDQDGKWVNIPSIWWDDEMHPIRFTREDMARDEGLRYEAVSGKKFPRYGTLKKAERAAKRRSKRGGGTQGTILEGE